MFTDQVKKEDTDFLQGQGQLDTGDLSMDVDDENNGAIDNENDDTPVDEDQMMQDLIFGAEGDSSKQQKKDAPKLTGKMVSINGIQVDRARLSQLIQVKIQRALDKCELSNQRSQKCDETSFLQLLYAFNQEGIRFS